MSNIINYSEIDELCIPVIRLCNDKLDMRTLFCCQGKSLDDGPNDSHSNHPYILFLESPETLDKLKKLIQYQLSMKLNKWTLTYAPFNGVDRWNLTYNPSKSRIVSKYHLSKVKDVWIELYITLAKLFL